MKKYLFIMAAVLSFSSAAHAGLLLEPYVGYFAGKFKGEAAVTAPIVGTTTTDDSAKGVAYGGKVGFSLLNIGAGMDYMAISPKVDDDTFKSSNVGAFVQVSVPLVCKLSASYFFSSKLSGSSNGSDVDFSGKGFKAGIGLTMIPMLSINIDYVAMTYDEIEMSGITFSNPDYKMSGVMVGVSLPLDL